MQAQAVRLDAQAAKAGHQAQPGAPHVGGMDAVPGVAVGVVQVQRG